LIEQKEKIETHTIKLRPNLYIIDVHRTLCTPMYTKKKKKYPISLQKSLLWKGGEENCFGEGKFLWKGRN
jgi:hypothetical protein